MLRKLGITLAAIGGCMALAPSANAFGHRIHYGHAKAVPVLIPAHLRPGYVGAEGYPGGPAGPRDPAFIDIGYGGFPIVETAFNTPLLLVPGLDLAIR